MMIVSIGARKVLKIWKSGEAPFTSDTRRRRWRQGLARGKRLGRRRSPRGRSVEAQQGLNRERKAVNAALRALKPLVVSPVKIDYCTMPS